MADKPYPWTCGDCGKKEVYPVTQDYTTDIKRNGALHRICVKQMPIPTCRSCGSEWFSTEQGDMIEAAYKKKEKSLFKLIVAGSREGVQDDDVDTAIRNALKLWDVLPCGVMVISGGARGVDTAGEQWASERNLPVLRFPADWHKHGKSAGFRRNVEMADNADALVAVWDGTSKGTKHMIDTATKKGLKVHVHKVTKGA